MNTEAHEPADDYFCKALNYIGVAVGCRTYARSDPSVGALGRISEKYARQGMAILLAGMASPAPSRAE